MHPLLTIRGRLAPTLVTGALLVAGSGALAAHAMAQTPGGGLFATAPTSGQTAPGLKPRPGLGLFKALFAVFGAVRAEVPTIAAPIIAQGVAGGTITPAEATELTALLAGKRGPTGPTGPATKPSAGEISVLRKVFAAVIGQLPAIAAPVLVGEVAAGDITQAEADAITKVLTGLSSLKTPGAAPAGAGPTGTAGAGGLLSRLESKVAAEVRTTAEHRKHKRHGTRSHQRSG
jgi:hypothetical protein